MFNDENIIQVWVVNREVLCSDSVTPSPHCKKQSKGVLRRPTKA